MGETIWLMECDFFSEISIGEEVTRGPSTAYHMTSWNWGISTPNFHYLLLSIIYLLLYWCKSTTISPFYQHGLTSKPAWISNHKASKVCNEITYQFQTSAAAPSKLEMNNWFNHTFWNGCNVSFILGLTLNHVSKKDIPDSKDPQNQPIYGRGIDIVQHEYLYGKQWW